MYMEISVKLIIIHLHTAILYLINSDKQATKKRKCFSVHQSLTVGHGSESVCALAPEGLCASADGSDSGVVLLLQVKGLLRHVTFALCDGAALIHTPPSHLLTAAPLRIPVSAGKQHAGTVHVTLQKTLHLCAHYSFIPSCSGSNYSNRRMTSSTSCLYRLFEMVFLICVIKVVGLVCGVRYIFGGKSKQRLRDLIFLR